MNTCVHLPEFPKCTSSEDARVWFLLFERKGRRETKNQLYFILIKNDLFLLFMMIFRHRIQIKNYLEVWIFYTNGTIPEFFSFRFLIKPCGSCAIPTPGNSTDLAQNQHCTHISTFGNSCSRYTDIRPSVARDLSAYLSTVFIYSYLWVYP